MIRYEFIKHDCKHFEATIAKLAMWQNFYILLNGQGDIFISDLLQTNKQTNKPTKP
jgi:hypothetical protein